MIAALVLAVSLGQADFDRGLASYYAYDREGARRAFAQALQKDPHFAMAAWGEALAAAGDLNHSLSPEAFAQAQAFAKQAADLRSYAGVRQQAYIDAIAVRYIGTFDQRDTDEQRYLQAMENIVAANPADDDAAVLTAEALLEDNEPPSRALALLQRVLLRNPQNVMANHLCIHAYERTPDAARAIPCADRLRAMAFPPQFEHLAHMPAHTYVETGAYAKAVAASETAWQMRQAWNAQSPPYELDYGAHDAAIAYSAAMMLGDEPAAQRWGARLGEQIGASLDLLTMARFAHWDGIIAQASANAARKSFALGLAYARTNDIPSARTQLAALRRNPVDTEFFNLLDGAIDEQRGDVAGAVASYTRALDGQKRDYSEEYIPLFPAGEMLGSLYLHAQRYREARSAYENTLARYPNDPRALAGLALVRANLSSARPPNRSPAGKRLFRSTHL